MNVGCTMQFGFISEYSKLIIIYEHFFSHENPSTSTNTCVHVLNIVGFAISCTHNGRCAIIFNTFWDIFLYLSRIIVCKPTLYHIV